MTKPPKLMNLGPKSMKVLAELGIFSLEDIAAWGPAKIWHALKTSGRPVTMLMVYALQGALMHTHWNALPPEVKEHLKQQCQDLEGGS